MMPRPVGRGINLAVEVLTAFLNHADQVHELRGEVALLAGLPAPGGP
jgi:hypothetical protein